MSFYYYRAPRAAEKVENYGFRKVGPSELAGIIERVSRPTYNSQRNTETQGQGNYSLPYRSRARRPPTSCRRQRAGSAPPAHSERRLSDRELQRVVRRLTRTTVSYEASRYDFIPPDDSAVPLEKLIRPKSVPGDERLKAFQQLSRPTTASRAKTLGDCVLCADRQELQRKNTLVPFEYEYDDDRLVPPEELEEIVERVSAPTFAHKAQRCPRTPAHVDEVLLRRNVPLVSGLPRTATVRDIVRRLHAARGRHVTSPVTHISILP